MMKKAGILLMAMLYVVTASGFALNLHYCCNQVASVKINAPAKSCAKPIAKTKMKCCKDARLDVKVKDSHESQPTSVLSKIFAFPIPRTYVEDYFLPAEKSSAKNSSNSSPPDKVLNSTSIFAKNCFLRI